MSLYQQPASYNSGLFAPDFSNYPGLSRGTFSPPPRGYGHPLEDEVRTFEDRTVLEHMKAVFRHAVGGAIQGFSTFRVIDDIPERRYEQIASSLGFLFGFAGGLHTLPLKLIHGLKMLGFVRGGMRVALGAAKSLDKKKRVKHARELLGKGYNTGKELLQKNTIGSIALETTQRFQSVPFYFTDIAMTSASRLMKHYKAWEKVSPHIASKFAKNSALTFAPEQGIRMGLAFGIGSWQDGTDAMMHSFFSGLLFGSFDRFVAMTPGLASSGNILGRHGWQNPAIKDMSILLRRTKQGKSIIGEKVPRVAITQEERTEAGKQFLRAVAGGLANVGFSKAMGGPSGLEIYDFLLGFYFGGRELSRHQAQALETIQLMRSKPGAVWKMEEMDQWNGKEGVRIDGRREAAFSKEVKDELLLWRKDEMGRMGQAQLMFAVNKLEVNEAAIIETMGNMEMHKDLRDKIIEHELITEEEFADFQANHIVEGEGWTADKVGEMFGQTLGEQARMESTIEGLSRKWRLMANTFHVSKTLEDAAHGVARGELEDVQENYREHQINFSQAANLVRVIIGDRPGEEGDATTWLKNVRGGLEALKANLDVYIKKNQEFIQERVAGHLNTPAKDTQSLRDGKEIVPSEALVYEWGSQFIRDFLQDRVFKDHLREVKDDDLIQLNYDLRRFFLERALKHKVRRLEMLTDQNGKFTIQEIVEYSGNLEVVHELSDVAADDKHLLQIWRDFAAYSEAKDELGVPSHGILPYILSFVGKGRQEKGRKKMRDRDESEDGQNLSDGYQTLVNRLSAGEKEFYADYLGIDLGDMDKVAENSLAILKHKLYRDGKILVSANNDKEQLIVVDNPFWRRRKEGESKDDLEVRIRDAEAQARGVLYRKLQHLFEVSEAGRTILAGNVTEGIMGNAESQRKVGELKDMYLALKKLHESGKTVAEYENGRKEEALRIELAKKEAKEKGEEWDGKDPLSPRVPTGAEVMDMLYGIKLQEKRNNWSIAKIVTEGILNPYSGVVMGAKNNNKRTQLYRTSGINIGSYLRLNDLDHKQIEKMQLSEENLANNSVSIVIREDLPGATTDGAIFASKELMDLLTTRLGLDPDTGTIKIAGIDNTSEDGVLIIKAALHATDARTREIMEREGIHLLAYQSAVKGIGNRNVVSLDELGVVRTPESMGLGDAGYYGKEGERAYMNAWERKRVELIGREELTRREQEFVDLDISARTGESERAAVLKELKDELAAARKTEMADEEAKAAMIKRAQERVTKWEKVMMSHKALDSKNQELIEETRRMEQFRKKARKFQAHQRAARKKGRKARKGMAIEEAVINGRRVWDWDDADFLRWQVIQNRKGYREYNARRKEEVEKEYAEKIDKEFDKKGEEHKKEIIKEVEEKIATREKNVAEAKEKVEEWKKKVTRKEVDITYIKDQDVIDSTKKDIETLKEKIKEKEEYIKKSEEEYLKQQAEKIKEIKGSKFSEIRRKELEYLRKKVEEAEKHHKAAKARVEQLKRNKFSKKEHKDQARKALNRASAILNNKETGAKAKLKKAEEKYEKFAKENNKIEELTAERAKYRTAQSKYQTYWKNKKKDTATLKKELRWTRNSDALLNGSEHWKDLDDYIARPEPEPPGDIKVPKVRDRTDDRVVAQDAARLIMFNLDILEPELWTDMHWNIYKAIVGTGGRFNGRNLKVKDIEYSDLINREYNGKRVNEWGREENLMFRKDELEYIKRLMKKVAEIRSDKKVEMLLAENYRRPLEDVVGVVAKPEHYGLDADSVKIDVNTRINGKTAMDWGEVEWNQWREIKKKGTTIDLRSHDKWGQRQWDMFERSFRADMQDAADIRAMSQGRDPAYERRQKYDNLWKEFLNDPDWIDLAKVIKINATGRRGGWKSMKDWGDAEFEILYKGTFEKIRIGGKDAEMWKSQESYESYMKKTKKFLNKRDRELIKKEKKGSNEKWNRFKKAQRQRWIDTINDAVRAHKRYHSTVLKDVYDNMHELVGKRDLRMEGKGAFEWSSEKDDNGKTQKGRNFRAYREAEAGLQQLASHLGLARTASYQVNNIMRELFNIERKYMEAFEEWVQKHDQWMRDKEIGEAMARNIARDAEERAALLREKHKVGGPNDYKYNISLEQLVINTGVTPSSKKNLKDQRIPRQFYKNLSNPAAIKALIDEMLDNIDRPKDASENETAAHTIIDAIRDEANWKEVDQALAHKINFDELSVQTLVHILHTKHNSILFSEAAKFVLGMDKLEVDADGEQPAGKVFRDPLKDEMNNSHRKKYLQAALEANGRLTQDVVFSKENEAYFERALYSKVVKGAMRPKRRHSWSSEMTVSNHEMGFVRSGFVRFGNALRRKIVKSKGLKLSFEKAMEIAERGETKEIQEAVLNQKITFEGQSRTFKEVIEIVKKETDKSKVDKWKGFELKVDNFEVQFDNIYDLFLELGGWESSPKTFQETFKLTGMRSPAPTVSATRVLKFDGFLDQDGANVQLSNIDMSYMGGADLDIDKAVFFQDMPEAFKKEIEKNKWEFHEVDKHGVRKFVPEKTEVKDFVDSIGDNSDISGMFMGTQVARMGMNAAWGKKLMAQGLSNAGKLVPYFRERLEAMRKKGSERGKKRFGDPGGTDDDGVPYSVNTTLFVTKSGDRLFWQAKIRDPAKAMKRLILLTREITNFAADSANYEKLKGIENYKKLMFDAMFEDITILVKKNLSGDSKATAKWEPLSKKGYGIYANHITKEAMVRSFFSGNRHNGGPADRWYEGFSNIMDAANGDFTAKRSIIENGEVRVERDKGQRLSLHNALAYVSRNLRDLKRYNHNTEVLHPYAQLFKRLTEITYEDNKRLAEYRKLEKVKLNLPFRDRMVRILQSKRVPRGLRLLLEQYDLLLGTARREELSRFRIKGDKKHGPHDNYSRVAYMQDITRQNIHALLTGREITNVNTQQGRYRPGEQALLERQAAKQQTETLLDRYSESPEFAHDQIEKNETEKAMNDVADVVTAIVLEQEAIRVMGTEKWGVKLTNNVLRDEKFEEFQQTMEDVLRNVRAFSRMELFAMGGKKKGQQEDAPRMRTGDAYLTKEWDLDLSHLKESEIAAMTDQDKMQLHIEQLRERREEQALKRGDEGFITEVDIRFHEWYEAQRNEKKAEQKERQKEEDALAQKEKREARKIEVEGIDKHLVHEKIEEMRKEHLSIEDEFKDLRQIYYRGSLETQDARLDLILQDVRNQKRDLVGRYRKGQKVPGKIQLLKDRIEQQTKEIEALKKARKEQEEAEAQKETAEVAQDLSISKEEVKILEEHELAKDLKSALKFFKKLLYEDFVDEAHKINHDKELFLRSRAVLETASKLFDVDSDTFASLRSNLRKEQYDYYRGSQERFPDIMRDINDKIKEYSAKAKELTDGKPDIDVRFEHYRSEQASLLAEQTAAQKEAADKRAAFEKYSRDTITMLKQRVISEAFKARDIGESRALDLLLSYQAHRELIAEGKREFKESQESWYIKEIEKELAREIEPNDKGGFLQDYYQAQKALKEATEADNKGNIQRNNRILNSLYKEMVKTMRGTIGEAFRDIFGDSVSEYVLDPAPEKLDSLYQKLQEYSNSLDKDKRKILTQREKDEKARIAAEEQAVIDRENERRIEALGGDPGKNITIIIAGESQGSVDSVQDAVNAQLDRILRIMPTTTKIRIIHGGDSPYAEAATAWVKKTRESLKDERPGWEKRIVHSRNHVYKPRKSLIEAFKDRPHEPIQARDREMFNNEKPHHTIIFSEGHYLGNYAVQKKGSVRLAYREADIKESGAELRAAEFGTLDIDVGDPQWLKDMKKEEVEKPKRPPLYTESQLGAQKELDEMINGVPASAAKGGVKTEGVADKYNRLVNVRERFNQVYKIAKRIQKDLNLLNQDPTDAPLDQAARDGILARIDNDVKSLEYWKGVIDQGIKSVEENPRTDRNPLEIDISRRDAKGDTTRTTLALHEHSKTLSRQIDMFLRHRNPKDLGSEHLGEGKYTPHGIVDFAGEISQSLFGQARKVKGELDILRDTRDVAKGRTPKNDRKFQLDYHNELHVRLASVKQLELMLKRAEGDSQKLSYEIADRMTNFRSTGGKNNRILHVDQKINEIFARKQHELMFLANFRLTAAQFKKWIREGDIDLTEIYEPNGVILDTQHSPRSEYIVRDVKNVLAQFRDQIKRKPDIVAFDRIVKEFDEGENKLLGIDASQWTIREIMYIAKRAATIMKSLGIQEHRITEVLGEYVKRQADKKYGTVSDRKDFEEIFQRIGKFKEGGQAEENFDWDLRTMEKNKFDALAKEERKKFLETQRERMERRAQEVMKAQDEFVDNLRKKVDEYQSAKAGLEALEDEEMMTLTARIKQIMIDNPDLMSDIEQKFKGVLHHAVNGFNVIPDIKITTKNDLKVFLRFYRDLHEARIKTDDYDLRKEDFEAGIGHLPLKTRLMHYMFPEQIDKRLRPFDLKWTPAKAMVMEVPGNKAVEQQIQIPLSTHGRVHRIFNLMNTSLAQRSAEDKREWNGVRKEIHDSLMEVYGVTRSVEVLGKTIKRTSLSAAGKKVLNELWNLVNLERAVREETYIKNRVAQVQRQIEKTEKKLKGIRNKDTKKKWQEILDQHKKQKADLKKLRTIYDKIRKQMKNERIIPAANKLAELGFFSKTEMDIYSTDSPIKVSKGVPEDKLPKFRVSKKLLEMANIDTSLKENQQFAGKEITAGALKRLVDKATTEFIREKWTRKSEENFIEWENRAGTDPVLNFEATIDNIFRHSDHHGNLPFISRDDMFWIMREAKIQRKMHRLKERDFTDQEARNMAIKGTVYEQMDITEFENFFPYHGFNDLDMRVNVQNLKDNKDIMSKVQNDPVLERFFKGMFRYVDSPDAEGRGFKKLNEGDTGYDPLYSNVMALVTRPLFGFDTSEHLVSNFFESTTRGQLKQLASTLAHHEITKFEKRHGGKESLRTHAWADFMRLYAMQSLGMPAYWTESIINNPEFKRDPFSLFLSDTKWMQPTTWQSKLIAPFYARAKKRKGTKKEALKERAKDVASAAKEGLTGVKEHIDEKRGVKKEVKKKKEKSGFQKRHEERYNPELAAMWLRTVAELEGQYELTSLLFHPKVWMGNMAGGSLNTVIQTGFGHMLASMPTKKNLANIGMMMRGEEFGSYLEYRLFVQEQAGISESELTQEIGESTREASLRETRASAQLRRELGYRGTALSVTSDFLGNRFVRRRVSDAAFFIQNSENILRSWAFGAMYLKFADQMNIKGPYKGLGDHPVLFQMARRGVEGTQFLYDNANKPLVMSSSLGKIFFRFKVWVMRSGWFAGQIYKQAEMQGFKAGTEQYAMIQRWMLAQFFIIGLAQMFPYSLFDSILPAPMDQIVDLAGYIFTDDDKKRESFFMNNGDLGLVGGFLYGNIKPPISRIPGGIFGSMITGEWEKLGSYWWANVMPGGRFGRSIIQSMVEPKKTLQYMTGLPGPGSTLSAYHEKVKLGKAYQEKMSPDPWQQGSRDIWDEAIDTLDLTTSLNLLRH